ncbi:hypothetical protein BGW36DRAFT_146961 [Talaromyces proteolyticus]|uniref:Uncharacterized protein n=1 Tax=Talaromyces proteolyticus TaxID=1131652 RepID=A0AAD4PZ03_9EURO|nr:uncharacterized protein BGW36DRAFT_146961 [Talaromyces proteolyticus]KAH8698501.1 hypothetical protein BGW36DRAFT_146961 [Talaromyces proteolyticus]
MSWNSLLSISRGGPARYLLQAMKRNDKDNPIESAACQRRGFGDSSCGFYARNQVNVQVLVSIALQVTSNGPRRGSRMDGWGGCRERGVWKATIRSVGEFCVECLHPRAWRRAYESGRSKRCNNRQRRVHSTDQGTLANTATSYASEPKRKD